MIIEANQSLERRKKIKEEIRKDNVVHLKLIVATIGFVVFVIYLMFVFLNASEMRIKQIIENEKNRYKTFLLDSFNNKKSLYCESTINNRKHIINNEEWIFQDSKFVSKSGKHFYNLLECSVKN